MVARLEDVTGLTITNRSIKSRDKAYKTLVNHLRKQGDGACGLVYTQRLYQRIDELGNVDPDGYADINNWGSGHYQGYIVLNNKVYFTEAQAGYGFAYNSDKVNGTMMERIDPKGLGYIRLDNTKPKSNRLKDLVRM